MLGILDWLKLLFDKENRDAIMRFYALIRREQEWERSIKTLTCKTEKVRDVKYSAFLASLRKDLEAAGYDNEDVRNVMFIVQELVTNAILHGQGGGKPFAAIRILIGGQDCAIAVADGGAGFDLAGKLAGLEGRRDDTAVPHGIEAIHRVCPDIEQEQTSRGHSILVTYHRGAHPLAVKMQDNVVVVDCNISRNLSGGDMGVLRRCFADNLIRGRIVIRLAANQEDDNRMADTRSTRRFDAQLAELIADHCNVAVAIVGVETLAVPMREYLRGKFHCFEKLEDAVAFLKSL